MHQWDAISSAARTPSHAVMGAHNNAEVHVQTTKTASPLTAGFMRVDAKQAQAAKMAVDHLWRLHARGSTKTSSCCWTRREAEAFAWQLRTSPSTIDRADLRGTVTAYTGLQKPLYWLPTHSANVQTAVLLIVSSVSRDKKEAAYLSYSS